MPSTFSVIVSVVLWASAGPLHVSKANKSQAIQSHLLSTVHLRHAPRKGAKIQFSQPPTSIIARGDNSAMPSSISKPPAAT